MLKEYKIERDGCDVIQNIRIDANKKIHNLNIKLCIGNLTIPISYRTINDEIPIYYLNLKPILILNIHYNIIRICLSYDDIDSSIRYDIIYDKISIDSYQRKKLAMNNIIDENNFIYSDGGTQFAIIDECYARDVRGEIICPGFWYLVSEKYINRIHESVSKYLNKK